MNERSAPVATEALPADADGWAAFFSRYDAVVLVANSEQVDIEALKTRFGDGSLFVFFNKTYKVLSGRFDRPSLLVARSSAAGANIVHRREVGQVTQPLAGPTFRGVLNLKAAAAERFSPRADFGATAAGHLDLGPHFAGFYPSELVPSSGFAIAVWLAERRLATAVWLAGFSARRGARWKLFAVHDWTFEQTLLRLLARTGELRFAEGGPEEAGYAKLLERFPHLSSAQVATTLGEVVSERLAGTDSAVDRLFSLLRWQARLDGFLRSLKPRTRKQRLGAGADGDRAEDGLAKTRAGD